MEFNSIEFFRHLTSANKLCRKYEFEFCVCSGLEGFEDALHQVLDSTALICVDDTSSGGISTANTPHKKSFRTVYMYMRHTTEEDWMVARQKCFDIMREILRQFLTVVIRERTRLRLENVIINDQVTFHEIDRYFFTGGACAWFQLEVDKFVSLELNPEEWLSNPIPPRLSRLDVNMPRHSTTQC